MEEATRAGRSDPHLAATLTGLLGHMERARVALTAADPVAAILDGACRNLRRTLRRLQQTEPSMPGGGQPGHQD